MADLQCTWHIVDTDCWEIVSGEFLTLPELLEEVKALVEGWDDPSEEPPQYQLCRSTPVERAQMEAMTKRILERRGKTNG